MGGKVTFMLISYLGCNHNQLNTFNVFRAFGIGIGGKNKHGVYICSFAAALIALAILNKKRTKCFAKVCFHFLHSMQLACIPNQECL